jgi:hypothetical protein
LLSSGLIMHGLVRRVVSVDTQERKSLEHVGRRLRLARLRRHLSQEEMAERAGVTHRTCSSPLSSKIADLMRPDK